MGRRRDELVCPITQELPVDPVTAEDGRVYERQAMEEWLRSKAGQEVRSPVTNEPMGTKLFPAVQVRNTIKGMVKSGAISGDKAEAWKERIEKEKVAAVRRRHPIPDRPQSQTIQTRSTACATRFHAAASRNHEAWGAWGSTARPRLLRARP